MNIFSRSFIVLALGTTVVSCYTPSAITTGVYYESPAWGPSYYQGVRYYYLPDIEVYYDLSSQEFVYLNNGQWIFTTIYPSLYSSYDLFSGFVIALRWDVYRPWLHHHYYVSHYPRYYYYNIYQKERSTIRGFNENDRKHILLRSERDNVAEPRNIVPPERPQAPRVPDQTNYYGRKIGTPVKVKPQMKEPKKIGEPRKIPAR